MKSTENYSKNKKSKQQANAEKQNQSHLISNINIYNSINNHNNIQAKELHLKQYIFNSPDSKLKSNLKSYNQRSSSIKDDL